MKKLPENLFLNGRLILLKIIVFLFIACFTISCIESISPGEHIKKMQDKKKEGDDPEGPGDGGPPPRSTPDKRFGK